MRSFLKLLSFICFVGFLAGHFVPATVIAASNCPDSTATLVHLFDWGIPADGFDIAVGTNGFVYVTDPTNDRICRYSRYGSDVMCWDSPDPLEPGQFVEPRWLAWNAINDRVYVCGQRNLPVVSVYSASGGFLFDIRGDSLSTDPGQFAGGVGPIAIDPQTGFVWIYEESTLDNVTVDRIQEFDLTGTFTGRVFNRGSGCKLPGTSQIEDIAVDATGSVYLLDNRVLPFQGAVHRVVYGSGCIATWGNQGGPGALTNPKNIAVDKDGFINVLNLSGSGVSVRKYNRLGNHVSSLQISSNSSAYSFALDFMHDSADPFMYVAHFSPHRVELWGTGVEPRNILETSWVDSTSLQLKMDNLQLLAQCEDPDNYDPRIEMDGVVADGVSPLLFRLHLPETGTVRWKLADPDNTSISEGLGTLATLDSTDTGNVIETEVEIVDGEYLAFAAYTAPLDFERTSVPADINVGERPLEVTAVFMPDSEPDSVAIARVLKIERPTVLFLHGFLETPDHWRNFQSIKTNGDAARWGDRLIVADYSPTNGSRLATNAGHLEGYLQSATSSARRDRRIAAAQVDIVSHSMGGLVLRRFADAAPPDSFQFKSTFNMGRGYYHKALFLNAPHQGAPAANIAVTMKDIMKNSVIKLRRNTARRILEMFADSEEEYNKLVDGGAIEDMSLGSDALIDLQPFVAPTHGHVGTGGSDLGYSFRMLKSATKQKLLKFFALTTSLTNIPELALYHGEEHDAVVLLESQIGGANNFQYTTARFEDGLHESSLFSDLSGEVAREWGTTSVTNTLYFAPSLPGGSSIVPPPAVVAHVNDLSQVLQDEVPEFAGVTLRIVDPPSSVASGDSFLVEVEPYSDVSRVIVSYPGGALFMDSTLTGHVHTDVAFSGEFQLSALALMADGTVGGLESVVTTVEPLGSIMLNSISATPSAVNLAGVGALLALRVVGNYSDGIERNLTRSSSGTTYTDFDPGVISVSPDGVVRGASSGTTTLTVQKGAYTQAVAIRVGDAPAGNNRPQALAGGPYQICNGDGVTLNASNSFDFDGDQLTYSWDLNGDGQFDDLVGATGFYSPPYIVDERIVAVRVTDSNGATSEAYTTIQVPLSCFAGQRICAAEAVAFEASDLGVDNDGDIYIFNKFDTNGNIRKRDETCAVGAGSTAIFDPGDLDELAVDTVGVAYVIGAPSDERILRFGPGGAGDLTPLTPVSTTPYSLVTGIAVDARGNLYGSDYDTGAQHVFIRKFDQAQPDANLLASWNLTTSASISSAEPLSVAIGPDSAIFVAVGNEVLKGVAQGGGYVLERRWGSVGLGAGQFRGITDVAVGPDGDVFVSDYGNHRVQRFDRDGTFRSMRKGTHWPNGKFYHPTAVIAIDAERVTVADTEFGGEPRVQVFYWGDAVPTTVPPRPVVFRDALVQNYPNPFNPATTISFSLAENSHVVLAIYDVRGALVRTLIDEPRVAGEFRVEWNAENDSGARVSSGVYFYRLAAGRFQSTKKMVLLK